MNEQHTTTQHVSQDLTQPVIESASASTACQTNDSKFAYYLTGGILGVSLLLAVAIAMLTFAILQTGLSAYSYTEDMYHDSGYEQHDEHPFEYGLAADHQA